VWHSVCLSIKCGSMFVCLLCCILNCVCNHILISAVMEGMWLLDADIDSRHRAKALEGNPKKLNPLCTRTPKENWRIHPAWVERYLFITRKFSSLHYFLKLNCYVILVTQVEMGRAITIRASSRGH
jgi:hypothetical protein